MRSHPTSYDFPPDPLGATDEPDVLYWRHPHEDYPTSEDIPEGAIQVADSYEDPYLVMVPATRTEVMRWIGRDTERIDQALEVLASDPDVGAPVSEALAAFRYRDNA